MRTLLLVASDRISTFDVVLPTEIPDKGRVLTGLSAFWFARTRHIVPNHLVALRPDGRSLECRRLEMLPVEMVVRGYLSGSGWRDYLETGSVCGTALPTGRGIRATPAPHRDARDKGRTGPRPEHRRGEAEELAGGTAMPPRATRRSRSTASGVTLARRRGIVLADTKFEFGVDVDGQVTLADEAMTPDSSRFWPPKPTRRAALSRPSTSSTSATGVSPPAGTERRPQFPADVVEGTRARYVEAFVLLTEIPFDRYLDDPAVVL